MKLQKSALIIFAVTVMALVSLVVMSQKPSEVLPIKQWAGSSLVKGDIYRFGNVGIGTEASDSFKLAVEGRLGAREIIVQTEDWADHVFDENYPLLSLEKVEAFYHKNKHLPGVPSAEQVKQDGINIGQMNAKLLQKIEELTLYTVQLKKENQILKERLDTIQK